MVQVNFIWTCVIHKMLVLLKTTRILKRFLSNIIEFYFLERKFIFFQHVMMENPRPAEK